MVAWCQAALDLVPASQYAIWDQGGGPRFLQTKTGENALALFAAPHTQSDGGDHTVAFVVDGPSFLELWTRAENLGLMHPSGVSLSAMGPTDHHGLSWSMYFLSPEAHRFEITCYDIATVRDGLQ